MPMPELKAPPDGADPVIRLADEITDRKDCRLKSAIRMGRQDHPRASSVEDCPRKMFHQIKSSAARRPHTEHLQARFDRGNAIEKLVTRDLLGDGWEIAEQQRPFEIVETMHVATDLEGKRRLVGSRPGDEDAEDVVTGETVDLVIVTGHTDGRITPPGGTGPGPITYEIKSLTPFVFDRVNSARDLFDMGSFWRRWPRQLLLYMLKHGSPWGLWIIDDCLGHQKAVPVYLFDYLDEAREAYKLCEIAAVAAWEGVLPPYHDNAKTCRECWCFEAGICTPPVKGGPGVRIMDDETLVDSVARRAELTDDGKEYARLDRKIKDRMKAEGVGEYVIGDHLVTVTKKPRTAYEVPPEVRDQYRVDSSAFWVKTEPLLKVVS